MVGKDLGPYIVAPEWIWGNMKYIEDSAKTTMTLQSLTLFLPTNYIIHAASGVHFCKLVSPFKAMEWMVFDGLTAHYTASNQQAQSFLQ